MKHCWSTSVLFNTEHKLPSPLMKKNLLFYANLRCIKLRELCGEKVMSLQFNDNKDACDNILVIISFKIVPEGPNTFITVFLQTVGNVWKNYL